MGGFTPSTVPGCRAPHFWLADGRSLYDAFGPGYTLLRFDPRRRRQPLVAAARTQGMPLTVLDIAGADVPPALPPSPGRLPDDQHVAWRGDRLPDDAAALVRRCAWRPPAARRVARRARGAHG
jgi:hypothetical protein